MAEYIDTAQSSRVLVEKIDAYRLSNEWASKFPKPDRRKYMDHGYDGSDKEEAQTEFKVQGSARREVTHGFIHAMTKHTEGFFQTNTSDAPLPTPLINAGYSVNPTHQLKAYAEHGRSNYLVNLAEACFDYNFPRDFPVAAIDHLQLLLQVATLDRSSFLHADCLWQHR